MDIYEIVKKLVGEINPAGASHIDPQRFENLKVMTDLVGRLLSDIDYVAMQKNRPEHSISKAGNFADQFFADIEPIKYKNEE